MENVEKSNKLSLHYYFKDESHSIDSLLRNECEKEILFMLKDISETLNLKLKLETLPPENGGFVETWKFIGENSPQITLLVSIATIIISRFPVQNKELTKLQIENLKLDNELKKKELEKLNLEFLQDENDISKELIKDTVNLVNKNYKVSWRKSNFYKKLNSYPKIDSIELMRYDDNSPVKTPRKINKSEFSSFILNSDELPSTEQERAIIDVISPSLKPGKFTWKGFYNKEIINFSMDDFGFKEKVLNGKIHFSNRYSIEVQMTQERKINKDGNIVVTDSIVHKVLASIEGDKRIEY